MLDYVDKSVLSSMEGVLGIEHNYSSSSSAYGQLQESFQAENTKTVESKPGLNGLLAYDIITIVTKALEKLNTNSSSSKMLLEEMLSSNFNGLIGDIKFKKGKLSYVPMLRIIKVVDNDKKHMELDTLTPKFKFARSLGENTGDGGKESLNDSVPKTWKVPSDTNPLKVAIPMHPSTDSFLKVSQNQTPTGFCIDLFKEIREILSDQYFGLPYKFYPLNESYDSILFKVMDEVNSTLYSCQHYFCFMNSFLSFYTCISHTNDITLHFMYIKYIFSLPKLSACLDSR